MPGMPTRRGTLSRPRVGREPRKGQGEIPGAEKSVPHLDVIPGRARKASRKSGTHISHDAFEYVLEDSLPSWNQLKGWAAE
eukprot:5228697-Prymnesium_polylepis.1